MMAYNVPKPGGKPIAPLFRARTTATTSPT